MHFPVLYRKDINETVSLIYGPMRPITTVKPIADKLEVIQEGSTKLEEELEEEWKLSLSFWVCESPPISNSKIDGTL